MTHLEQLIKAQVEQTTVQTVSTATARIAEEMARELLKDATFRAELQAMIRTHFGATMRALARNSRPRARKTAKRRRP